LVAFQKNPRAIAFELLGNCPMPPGYVTACTLGPRAFFTKSSLENDDIFSLVYFFSKNHPRNHIYDQKNLIFAAFLETGFVVLLGVKITCDTKLLS
jgi:hypothetical protein